MSRTVLLCAVVAAVCAAVGVSGLESSDLDKFESIDMTSILSNKRLRTAYVNCMLDKGPCTTDGAEFKKVVPDLMETGCAACSPKFKEMSKKAISVFKNDYPEDWEALMKHFDPDGSKMPELEKFMSES